MEKRLVKTNDVARALGISPWTVDAWRRTGAIPFVRVGRLICFDLDDVVARFKRGPAERATQ